MAAMDVALLCIFFSLVVFANVLEPSYGMYIWPCAPVLAQYVWFHRDALKDKHVLEIGAGTALPGVLAAKLGARVTLSDSSHLPKCLDNCRRTCVANGLSSVDIIGITWGEVNPGLVDLPAVDIILGSDCFYDTQDFEGVLATVKYLLDKNFEAEFWTTYQVRSSSRSLAPLLVKWGLQSVYIPLSAFSAEGSSIAGTELPGSHTIQLLIIKLKSS